MRFSMLASAAVSAICCAGAVQAQTREEILRCRAIESPDRRVACYDAIPLSPAAPLSKYQPVPLEELLGFALSYRGSFVEVGGWIEPGARFFLLKRSSAEASALPVDLRSLTRSQQQAVRDECGTGCEATVQGRVDPVNFTTGITAEAVIVH